MFWKSHRKRDSDPPFPLGSVGVWTADDAWCAPCARPTPAQSVANNIIYYIHEYLGRSLPNPDIDRRTEAEPSGRVNSTFYCIERFASLGDNKLLYIYYIGVPNAPWPCWYRICIVVLLYGRCHRRSKH